MGFSRVFIVIFLVTLFLSTISTPALADCADPAAEKGSIVYNDTFSTMMFCDGTVWWDMKAGTGSVWFLSGGDISYSSGNVGVGIDAPLSTLHVAGPLLLDNSGSCDGGGVNKGALRLNAAADALEICDGAGSWIPFAAEGGGGSGGGGGGSGSGDTLLTDWPDAIKCADSAIDLVLYLRNFDSNRVAYAPPQVDANPQYILYDKDSGDYFSHSNMAGFDCVDNSWSVANLESASRTFGLVSSGSGLSDTTNCADGDEIFFDSSSGGVRCADKTPEAFTFADQTGVGQGDTINSDILQITGLEGNADIAVSSADENNPLYRICADSTCASAPAFTSTSGSLAPGNYLQLRQTGSPNAMTTTAMTVTVGGISDLWEVTTGDQYAIFDGSGDYLYYNNSGSYLSTPAGTYEAWVYFDTAPTGAQSIYSKKRCTYTGWLNYITSTSLVEMVGGSPTNTWEYLAHTVSGWNTGQWYHLVTSRGPAGMKIYIDGVLVESDPAQTDPNSEASPDILYIGATSTSGGCAPEYFNGRMDALKVYLRQLDDAEVAQSFADGRGASTVSNTDLFMQYDFTGNFNDTSGGGHNLTPVGNVTIGP